MIIKIAIIVGIIGWNLLIFEILSKNMLKRKFDNWLKKKENSK